jgi:C4-type Zn-finger protein
MDLNTKKKCPMCKHGMMQIWWLQYNNPPEEKPMLLQRVKWGCSCCQYTEVLIVVEKPRPYIEQRKDTRTWGVYNGR